FIYDRSCFFFFQAEDGIRDFHVTGVQTCALPILPVSIQRAETSFDGVEDLLVYSLNQAGPSLKSATLEVLGIKDCAASPISITSAGAADTAAVSVFSGALLAVGDQGVDGKQELLLVD